MNKKQTLTLITALAVALNCSQAVVAEETHAQNDTQTMRARMGETTDQTRFNKMIDQAAEVYGAIVKGPHGEVPSGVMKNSRCIAILPNVTTGALVVGGTHGEGFASCSDNDNVWSQPAPISLNQGSIGLQAGAKSADLVLFFQTNEAVQALKRGNFELGSDVSAVAGTYDSTADTSHSGVVIYSRAEGLFAGAAINGGKVGKDQSNIASFYGKKVDYTAVLEGKEIPDTTGYSQRLTKLFP